MTVDVFLGLVGKGGCSAFASAFVVVLVLPLVVAARTLRNLPRLLLLALNSYSGTPERAVVRGAAHNRAQKRTTIKRYLFRGKQVTENVTLLR